MGYPQTAAAFHPGLKPFTSQFFNQRRRKKRRDDRKPLVRSECIDSGPDFRKWLDASSENRPNIQCFEFTLQNELLLELV